MSHHVIKRVVSQQMVTSQNKYGKQKSLVNILTATKKNNKTKIIRHIRANNKKSTLIIKSKGRNGTPKKYSVIEENNNGSIKKFDLPNEKSVRSLLNTQKKRIMVSNKKVTRKLNFIKEKINRKNSKSKNSKIKNSKQQSSKKRKRKWKGRRNKNYKKK